MTERVRDVGRSSPVVPWTIDAAIAIALVILSFVLAPVMPDGDGVSHAARGISATPLVEMEPKHSLYTLVLHGIYRALVGLGLGAHALVAFTFVSHLAAAGTYLLLARRVYPRVIEDRRVASLCALAVALSFASLSRGAAIETYPLALALDVLLVALCLAADLRRPWPAVTVGLLYAIAIGVHITNVLVGLFVVAAIAAKAPGRRLVVPLGAFAVSTAAALVVLGGLILFGKGALAWPPDVNVLLPAGDPQPTMTIAARLGRAAYGFARAIAWLPPVRQLSGTLGLAYGIVMAGAIVLLVVVARRARWQNWKAGVVLLGLAVLAGPFIALGVYYYPSDPERWIFVLPAFWLLIGVIWDRYRPDARSWLTGSRALLSLALTIGTVGAYNAYALTLPDNSNRRDFAGLVGLAATVERDDLVLSPGGVTSPIYGFIVGAPLPVQNVTVPALVMEHGARRECVQAELARRLDEALRAGRHVYVYALIDEGIRRGEGYPWAFFEDYGPETFLDVVGAYPSRPVIRPSPTTRGTFQLTGARVTREPAPPSEPCRPRRPARQY